MNLLYPFKFFELMCFLCRLLSKFKFKYMHVQNHRAAAVPYNIEHQEDILQDYIQRHFSPIQELQQIPDNLIEEEICTTFCKDLNGAFFKFWLAILPFQSEQNSNHLRNWDLWGPFILSVLFILIIGSDDKFMSILSAYFTGAGLVNFNIRSLGGSISYFQSLSILGYCMFPMIISTFILKILDLFKIKYMSVIMITLSITTIWSILSARAFVSVNVKPERRFVAIIPIALIYFYMTSHFVFYIFYSKAWQEGADASS